MSLPLTMPFASKSATDVSGFATLPHDISFASAGLPIEKVESNARVCFFIIIQVSKNIVFIK